MLETTHFEGEPPDRHLVYELRQRAFKKVSLPELLALIAERLDIPEGEVRRIAVVAYLGLAFGLGIRLGKEFAGCLERPENDYVNTEPPIGDAVVAEIEAMRYKWSQNLYPA
jgi:hypothetical protein